MRISEYKEEIVNKGIYLKGRQWQASLFLIATCIESIRPPWMLGLVLLLLLFLLSNEGES